MTERNPILITGGSGKLGRLMLSNLLSKGHQIITTCSSNITRDNLKNDFLQFQENLSVYVVDFRNDNACQNFVKKLGIQEQMPKVLVNNARSMSFLKLDKNGFCKREDFLGEYHMDVFIPYELSFLIASNPTSKLEKIINVGSQYGIVAANPKLYASDKETLPIQYSLAKCALHHLTKELAVRLSKQKIAVNCVAYGGVAGRVDEEFKKKYAELTPIKRMLKDEDVPGAISFLISDNASGMTGHIMVVDGGWSIW